MSVQLDGTIDFHVGFVVDSSLDSPVVIDPHAIADGLIDFNVLNPPFEVDGVVSFPVAAYRGNGRRVTLARRQRAGAV